MDKSKTEDIKTELSGEESSARLAGWDNDTKIWTCYCGQENNATVAECPRCGALIWAIVQLNPNM